MVHVEDEGSPLQTPCGASPSLSSAEDALKSQLEASDAAVTLKKKKSWFHSVRDVVQKSAFQARAAVDFWRSDLTTSELMSDRPPESRSEKPPQDCDSLNLADVNTPLQRPGAGSRTVAPRATNSSACQHLPRHTSRASRGSIHKIIQRVSGETARTAYPRRAPSPHPKKCDDFCQKRQTSITGSIVGSIKSIGRKRSMARQPIPETQCAPENSPKDIPLPSSPIDIPAAAPMIELDLGPTELMRQETESPRRIPSIEVAATLNDFGMSSTIESAPTVQTLEQALAQAPQHQHYRTPPSRNILEVPANRSSNAVPCAPASPMPGTNFTLEIDGTNAPAKIQHLQLFERSVNRKNGKETKEIRVMRSLDAMAEACAIAHAADDRAITSTSVDIKPSATREFVEPLSVCCYEQLEDSTTKNTPSTPPHRAESLSRADAASSCTVKSISPGFSKSFRQKSLNVQQPCESRFLQVYGNVDCDPFVAEDEYGHGTPRPDRDFSLPFRTKTSYQDSITPIAGSASIPVGSSPPMARTEKGDVVNIYDPLPTNPDAAASLGEPQKMDERSKGLPDKEGTDGLDFDQSMHDVVSSEVDLRARALQMMNDDDTLWHYLNRLTSPTPSDCTMCSSQEQNTREPGRLRLNDDDEQRNIVPVPSHSCDGDGEAEKVQTHYSFETWSNSPTHGSTEDEDPASVGVTYTGLETFPNIHFQAGAPSRTSQIDQSATDSLDSERQPSLRAMYPNQRTPERRGSSGSQILTRSSEKPLHFTVNCSGDAETYELQLSHEPFFHKDPSNEQFGVRTNRAESPSDCAKNAVPNITQQHFSENFPVKTLGRIETRDIETEQEINLPRPKIEKNSFPSSAETVTLSPYNNTINKLNPKSSTHEAHRKSTSISTPANCQASLGLPGPEQPNTLSCDFMQQDQRSMDASKSLVDSPTIQPSRINPAYLSDRSRNLSSSQGSEHGFSVGPPSKKKVPSTKWVPTRYRSQKAILSQPTGDFIHLEHDRTERSSQDTGQSLDKISVMSL